MIKKIMLSIFALSIMIVGVAGVSALTYSANLKGPEVYSGATVQSGTTSITTPTYTSVRGDRTYFYITTFVWLRSTVCVPNNSRKVYIRMYEDDVYPNADDLVKTYRFGFDGLQMKNAVESITTNTSGNIDSAGDPTAELYIKVSLDAVSGDTSATNGELFYYQFAVD